MELTIGQIGGYVVLLAHLPYALAIIRKKSKPSLATWSMWSVMLTITLVMQVMAGKQDPWGMLAAAVGTVLITILLIVYGEKKWSRFDTRCMMLSLVAMLVWIIAGSALAQVASLLALIIAGIPTIRNAWKNPKDENSLTWAMFALGFTLTLVGVVDLSSYINWIQPVTSTIFNSTIFLLSIRRKS